MDGSKLFTVLVVGDNPDELMKRYDINLKVDRYIKYRYLDADKMKKNSIKILTEITKNPKKFNLSPFHVDYFKQQIKTINDMSSFEYYSNVTNGLYYDEDGNALSDRNPNGKWLSYSIGKNFSLPLVLNNGQEVYQAYVKDINWNAIHMNNTSLYELVWQLVHGEKEPSNEDEEKILNNMKENINYFSSFKDMDEYVAHSCSFWHYAFLDENGWVDIDDGFKSIDWVINFYDKFISNLNPNSKITIFECTKNNKTQKEDIF